MHGSVSSHPVASVAVAFADEREPSKKRVLRYDALDGDALRHLAVATRWPALLVGRKQSGTHRNYSSTVVLASSQAVPVSRIVELKQDHHDAHLSPHLLTIYYQEV